MKQNHQVTINRSEKNNINAIKRRCHGPMYFLNLMRVDESKL
jgi:hypothetical protein